MHFYERIKQKFVYIYLFVLARRFYRFLKNFQNVGYDILERGYRNSTSSSMDDLPWSNFANFSFAPQIQFLINIFLL